MNPITRRTFLSSTVSVAAIGTRHHLLGKNRPFETGEKIHISEDIPVMDETDICVLGGSCTGVFAAIRAARLGANVILVEKQNHFGGVAPIVCTWHSLKDTMFEQQIIAGLTQETMERLTSRDAVKILPNSESQGFVFRPGDLKIVLDQMILEAGIKPYLHTFFSAPVIQHGELTGVIVENKSGRGVIKAKIFIDATGDGDLCARLGLPQYVYETLLPPTVSAFIDNWDALEGINLNHEIAKHGAEFNLKEGFVWGSLMPGSDIYMLAGTRIPGVNCTDIHDLTHAEIEGRRQVQAMLDILRKYYPDRKVVLHDFPASIGIRDTRHIKCQYQLTGDDILNGKRFPDAIANGSYRVDIHFQDQPGIEFRYLDGRKKYVRSGYPDIPGRWREKTETNPTFYQIPLRSLIPGTFDNLILAGRMLDADKVAFSGVRVMVNTNQMGEAAGVAAWLALDTNQPIHKISADAVRKNLAKGGSIII